MLDEVLLLSRAEVYAIRNNITLLTDVALGRGIDGAVWRTKRPSAVKAFWALLNYHNELECYRRLQRDNIRILGKFAIPALLGSSDELMVIEMSIVRPPYLLDFGKVYLDEMPPEKFDARMLAAEQAHARALSARNGLKLLRFCVLYKVDSGFITLTHALITSTAG